MRMGADVDGDISVQKIQTSGVNGATCLFTLSSQPSNFADWLSLRIPLSHSIKVKGGKTSTGGGPFRVRAILSD